MIEIVRTDNINEKEWKLKIDGEVIDKVNTTLFLDDLGFQVWLDKTPEKFFLQKAQDYFQFKTGEINEINITFGIGNVLDNYITQLFQDNFIPDEIKKRFFDDKVYEEDIFSTLFFNITSGVENKAVAQLNFGQIILIFSQFWKHHFSLFDFFKSVRNHLTLELIDEKEIMTGNFKFLLSESLTLKEIFNLVIDDLKNAFKNAFEKIYLSNKRISLITTFSNFPEEVRVPCEQYLLYFTEFLRDLGVGVTSDIEHRAGEVLFSVTPTDPHQALAKIKIALDAFLSLPKNQIVINADNEFEIAMLKVKANIDHLNSQLSLAKAEIRVKEREIQAFEATLETKDISIEILREKLAQHKRLLKGEIAEGIIGIEPETKEDKEEFFDGVFTLTQYEEKGFRVNLAQLYRKLKTLFNG